MQLLFLTQTYPRFPGDGAGPFIREIARGLVRGGDRVTVLAPHAAGLPERRDDDGVAFRTFRYAPEALEVVGYGRTLAADERVRALASLVTPAYLLGARAAVRRELAERHYDLVHAHWVVPNGLAAAWTDHGVPLALGTHGSDVFLAERRSLGPLVRGTLSRTAVLTGCSPELVDRICALGLQRNRAHVVPYGVDAAAFAPAPAERRRATRERLGLPTDALLVLGVGRMASKKGFQLLPQILPELLGRHPRAHVLLAGGGDLLPELRAATAGLRDRVHLPGAVLHSELPDLYAAADAFVLPAVHDAAGNVDGLPNVILEAMASGLPVVSSAISGIPLAITDGREGLLTAEADTAALLAALDALLGDAERRRTMGAAARSKVERELTWDAVAERHRVAYRQALASPRS